MTCSASTSTSGAAAAAPELGDVGTGRELFRLFRNAVSSADSGATIFATLEHVEDPVSRRARTGVTEWGTR